MKRRRTLAGILAVGVLLAGAALFWRHHFGSPGPARPVHAPVLPRPEWRPATARERQAGIASIRSQLEAFKKRDYRKAVLYQSSELRRSFPSVGAFRRMMETSYPQFTEYETVEFGEALAGPGGERLQIPVTLTGRDGVTVNATYLLILEDGAFRVEGVQGGQFRPGGQQPETTRNDPAAPHGVGASGLAPDAGRQHLDRLPHLG
jgi:uncharacterized protein DUF4864